MKPINDKPMTSAERAERRRAWLHRVAKCNGFDNWYRYVTHIRQETMAGRDVTVKAPNEDMGNG